MYAVDQQFLGKNKTEEDKEISVTSKPNRRHQEFIRIKSLTKQYKKANANEREVKAIFRRKRNYLQRAEKIRKSKKERRRKTTSQNKTLDWAKRGNYKTQKLYVPHQLKFILQCHLKLILSNV